jgi:hypothetical protein
MFFVFKSIADFELLDLMGTCGGGMSVVNTRDFFFGWLVTELEGAVDLRKMMYEYIYAMTILHSVYNCI